MKKRNNNIDFLRGIATICIIVIHTTFWSGALYLPKWFTNLSLLIDVPAFMFISGISYHFIKSVTKNIKGLIIQWKKWFFFIIIYSIIIFVFYRSEFHIKDFLCWLVYYFPNQTSLRVVGGSIWFIIMYIKVSILCSIIISINNYFEKNAEKQVKNLISIMGLIIIVFAYTSFIKFNEFIFDQTTLFYSLLYLLGYISMNYKINLKQTIFFEIINIILLIITMYGYRYTVTDFQTMKFPPSVPYLFLAMLSIILFWYLKDKLKIKDKNPINYIGKNALWFYFAQGVSSSLIFYIYDFIAKNNYNYHYLLTFSIMLFFNIIITLIIAILLEKAYNLLCKADIISKLSKYKLLKFEENNNIKSK